MKLITLLTLLEHTSVAVGKWLQTAPCGSFAIVPYETKTKAYNIFKIEKAVTKTSHKFIKTAGNFIRIESATDAHYWALKQPGWTIKDFTLN